MRYLLIVALGAMALSGCATYIFQKAHDPYGDGYVVAREKVVVPEYTLGQGTTTPDLAVARERFARRKSVVEDYYKKMGIMENRFKENFYDHLAAMVKLATGVFRVPGLIIREYRMNHNPAYRARVRKLQEEQDACEAARTQQLKEGLRAYLDRDLAGEK